jgi:hypothetical protein
MKIELSADFARQYIIDIYRDLPKRRSGADAGSHPVAVGDHFGEPELRIAGYFHDYVEDGMGTQESLEMILPERSARIVNKLTRRKWEPYWFYIWRVSLDEDATVVKLADIDHNDDRFAKHKKRYASARSFLRGSIMERILMRSRAAGNILCLPLIAGGIMAVLAFGATISSQNHDLERQAAQIQMIDMMTR